MRPGPFGLACCNGTSSRPATGHRTGAAIVLVLSVVFSVGGCALPRWPIEDSITSPFGLRWNGVLPGVHRGVDLRASEGTPVRSMAEGRIRFAGWMNGYGNVVWVDHGPNVISVYAHLSEILVAPGNVVELGELIGLSGSTGDVSGPHLHFEIWRSGRQIDPIGYLGGPP